MDPECCIPFITCFRLLWNAFKVDYFLHLLTYYTWNNLLFIATFVTLTHNLTKQWQCINYFNVTITIVLVTSQKRHRVVSETAGVFSRRAILEIIAQEGHTKHVIALCFQPIKTLDFTQTCNKVSFANHTILLWLS